MTKPIRTEQDLDAALERISQLMGAAPGSAEADELEVLGTLMEAYEARNHEIAPGDPLEVIRFKMKELGISQNELGRRACIPSGRVSEILSGRRELTLSLVMALAGGLGISPALLVGGAAQGAGWTTLVVTPGLAALLHKRCADQGLSMNRLLADAFTGAVTTTCSAGRTVHPDVAAGAPSFASSLRLPQTPDGSSLQCSDTIALYWGPHAA